MAGNIWTASSTVYRRPVSWSTRGRPSDTLGELKKAIRMARESHPGTADLGDSQSTQSARGGPEEDIALWKRIRSLALAAAGMADNLAEPAVVAVDDLAVIVCPFNRGELASPPERAGCVVTSLKRVGKRG